MKHKRLSGLDFRRLMQQPGNLDSLIPLDQLIVSNISVEKNNSTESDETSENIISLLDSILAIPGIETPLKESVQLLKTTYESTDNNDGVFF